MGIAAQRDFRKIQSRNSRLLGRFRSSVSTSRRFQKSLQQRNLQNVVCSTWIKRHINLSTSAEA